ncbi:hypothetical protein CARUB_v10007747mg [Capsella rubella]|uniref:Uncharacterized protein n=1 Tax=Capsella rubella TaxID=81985 RepID=R0FBF8_9BRAS|nr:hypothetical protein CARUB_v10007747mg [Capsella rubella]
MDLFLYICNIVLEETLNGVGANNALPSTETQQEKRKMSSRGGLRHWTESEDLKLTELVAAHGFDNWDLIGEKMQTRSGKSCRVRWFNQLDPTINRAPFTEEEERIIVSSHNYYGNQWVKIARHLKGRTENDVRHHWNYHLNRPARGSHIKPKTRYFTPPMNPHGYPGLCPL